jgi:acyl dehydratase
MTTAFDAIAVGAQYDFGSYDFTAERIKDFARIYDPQSFHVDEAAAARSAFGGLIASGWQTTLMALRLQADYFARRARSGEAVPRFGAWSGVDMLRWMKPVYAGDRIAYSGTIRAKQPSSGEPGWGLISFDYAGINQKGEPVFTMTGHVHVAL